MIRKKGGERKGNEGERQGAEKGVKEGERELFYVGRQNVVKRQQKQTRSIK